MTMAFPPERRSTGIDLKKTLKSSFDEDGALKVKVLAAGALTNSLPSGKVIVEAESLNVKGVIDSLIVQYGSRMAQELMNQGRLRDGLVLLVNGRNVLSLPEGFETPLQEGDEVLITIMVAGG